MLGENRKEAGREAGQLVMCLFQAAKVVEINVQEANFGVVGYYIVLVFIVLELHHGFTLWSGSHTRTQEESDKP